MIRDNLLLIGVVVLLVGLGAVGVIGAYQSPQTQSTAETYSASDTERPQIELSESTFDFGAMSVKDTKTRDITVTNTGSKPLTVKNFGTSCDCTMAWMSVEGSKSPMFTMHGPNTWSGTIEPGKTGTLTVEYQPSLMPVQGQVERVVFFATNDPTNPKIEVAFTATVQ